MTGTSESAGPGDVGRNMAFAALTNMIAPAAAFATAPILARALGVEERGEAGAAVAPLLLMTAVAAIGLPSAITVLSAKRPEIARFALLHATALVTASGILATVAAIVLAPVLSGGAPGLAELIAATSLAIVPSLIVATLRGAASGHHAWSLVNADKLLSAITRLAGIVVLMVNGMLSLPTAVAVIALSPVVGGLAYLRLPRHMMRGGAAPAGYRISRDLLGFGSRVWIGSMSGILLSRLDQVLIVPLSDANQLGYYVTAVSVAEVALVANNAVRDVILSSDAASSDNDVLTRSARVSFLVSILISVAVAISMWAWFPLLFGSEFAAAIPVAIILIVAGTIGVPGSVAGAGLSSRGHPGLRSLALLIAVVVNVIMLVILVPTQGAGGAAVATLVGNLVSANLSLAFFCRMARLTPAAFYLVRWSDVRTLIGVLGRLRRGAAR